MTVFDNDVNTSFPCQQVTNKDVLKDASAHVYSGGSTNLSGGLLKGHEEALKECREGQVNRVLLLTDGMANRGITDPKVLAAKARSMLDKGVSLSAIGVGTSFNEDLLIALAESGGGTYYYVKDSEDIRDVFKSELKGLLAVVAQGITLTFEGLSSAKVTTVFGHEPVFSGSGATLALPDMFADEEKHIAVELSFPALPAGEHPLLRLKLSYADACHCLAQTSVELTAHLTAASDVMEPCEPNFEVITNVKLIRTAVAKDESAKAIDDGDYVAYCRIIGERVSALDVLAAKCPDDQPMLLREISKLKESLLHVDRARCDSQFRAELRKDLRYEAYYYRSVRPMEDNDMPSWLRCRKR